MNDQLKQRLVGAVVLVSLAVIFIPMILPGGGEDSSSLVSKKVPPEPDYRFPPPKKPPKAPSIGNVPIVPIGDSKNTSNSSTKDKKTGENNTASVPDKNQEKKPAARTPVAKTPVAKTKVPKVIANTQQQPVTSADIKSGQTTGWIVQVGSFSSEPHAITLRDKLRKMGYACFIEAVKSKGGMVYRVRVGPELTRDSAEKLRNRLASKAKVKGLVQTYP